MDTNTDLVRALIAKWRQQALDRRNTPFPEDGGEDLDACANQLQAALASAPPSAPVDIQPMQRVGGDPANPRDDSDRYCDHCPAGELASAPPSAPVGVDDVLGFLPAPLTHSQAWPQGYVDGFNACAKLAEEQVRIALAQQPATVFRNDGNTEADFIAHEANACTACGGSGHKADQQPAGVDEAMVRDLLPDGWSQDCQGKEDYDADLVALSCRYYPPNYRRDARHSAHAALVYGDGLREIAGKEFDAPTEEGVKALVEGWARQKISALTAALAAQQRG